MHDLEITWSGGQKRFTPDESPVNIGRSSSADVVVPQGTVSRRHLVMTWSGRAWDAEDKSTHGTFDPIGVRLATNWTVGTNVMVRLGSPRGAELSMQLITRPLDDVTAANPYADPESPPTVVNFGPPPPLDPNAEGAGLLHVPDPHEPAHRVDPSIPVEPVADEPEPLSPQIDAPSFEPEPVAFEEPNFVPDPGYLGDAQQDEIRLDVDDVVADSSSYRSEPGEFGQTDSATLGADSSAGQQTLVSPPNSPSLDASDAGHVSSELDLADSAAVDFTAEDPVIHLDGSFESEQQPLAPAVDPNLDPAFEPLDAPNHDSVGSAASDPGFGNESPVTELDQRHEPAIVGQPTQQEAGRPAATFVENDTLRLQIDGEDYVFLPGHEVTVGRDPHCTVTVDERHSLVSRRHLRFVHAEGSWWLEDASSKGTFVDGRRLNRPYKSEGAFIAHLGDGAAGTQLRVVTQGQHRQPTNRAGLAIAAVAAAALVLAALVALFVFGGSDNDAAALSTAKKSTVMLLSESGHGSGFFVSESLIVTNQHVAAMADQLVVAVSPEEDEPAEIQYVATLVENHPFLDIAVVKITNEADFNDQGTVTIGQPVESTDVPALPLGDSGAVTIGDPVTSTGFPGRFSVSSSDDAGQLRLAPVSTTKGQAANFTSWPSCSTPDLASFIPADAPPTVTCSASGNIEKGVLLASFPSGEGASGSAVIHEDKVVAVLFAGDSEDATASRSITTNAFSDWLSGVLTE